MLAILLQLIDDPEDKRKFEDIYSRYERLMFIVARDILKDPYKAEDAVNDAFINIIKNFEKTGAADSPRTKRFVVIIVRNICFNMLKKDKRHPEVLSNHVSEIDQHAAPAEDSFFDSYSIEKLKETIRMLPAKQAPHCIRNHRERKSTVTEKVLLLVRTFSEKYQRAKIILSNLGRILRINFPTTCREYKTHFQPSWSEV